MKTACNGFMSTRTRSLRTGLILGVGVVAVLALSGCSAVKALTGGEHHSEIYPDAATAKAGLDALPTTAWIADDATSVRVKYGEKGAILTYTSKTAPATEGCTEIAAPTDVAVVDSWWPTTMPEKVFQCGSWEIFSTDGHVYGYTRTAS